MQLQFHTTKLPCLRRLKGELQTHEQTQELRLPDGMPDIGVILGAWGQTVLRGKQWLSRSAELSCGVMVWVMYQPEDGSQPQMVEGWLPMSMDWDLPDTDRDGTMQVQCLLKSVDARPVSGRKLMLRACAEAQPRLWVRDEVQLYSPQDLPPDIRLLEKTHTPTLPREAGEKAFDMDEELTLPDSVPPMDKLLRFSLYPEGMEEKVMADKVVFRGVGHLHIAYQDTDGQLQSYDFRLPFSQYAELEQIYDSAQAVICPQVTSVELDRDDMGRLHLKAGLTGQYLITDQTAVTLVEDAYSPDRPVSVSVEALQLPAILEASVQPVSASAAVPLECRRVADVAFYPSQPKLSRGGAEGCAELSGHFQVLCYDDTGSLQSAAPKWHTEQPVPASSDVCIAMESVPEAMLGPETALSARLRLHACSMADKGLPMVTALEVGEASKPDPNRPSLVICRAGEASLWQLARQNGSTVEAIRAANHLTDDPEEDRLLLIPVL